MSALTRTLVCEVVIDGNPVPKARPRTVTEQIVVNGRVQTISRTHTPRRTAQAEDRIGWAVKAALVGDPDDEKYAIEARFFERRGPDQQADGDNCLKTVQDALNGIVWFDDRQVVEGHYWMERNAARPRTELRIFQLAEGS